MAKSLLEQTPGVGLGNAEDQSVRSEFAAAQNHYKQAQDTFAQAQSALDIYSKTKKGSEEKILFNADYTQTKDTDGTATGSRFTDFISKFRVGNGFDVTGDGSFRDPYDVAQSYINDYKTRHTGDMSEGAYEEAYQMLKQMQNNNSFSEKELQNAANELLSVQTNGDVQTALDSLGSASAKEYYYGVENVFGYEKNYNQAIFQAETYAKSGVVNDEEAAKIAYDAYIDGLRMEDLNKIADTLAGSDGGGDAEKIGNNLYYYLNWKDPEITALDEVNAAVNSLGEGIKDAGTGITTSVMKIIGLEEFIPDAWQQPNWNEKMIGDVKDETGLLGDLFIDTSYSVGNMLPSMVANTVLPGSGLAVTFLGTAGQSYNDAITAGHTDSEATTYALLNASINTLTEATFGVIGKGVTKISAASSLKKVFGEIFDELISDKTVANMLSNVISGATGEFADEYIQQALTPIAENIAFDGETFTFQNNPIELISKENFYAGMVGLLSGGTVEWISIAGDVLNHYDVLVNTANNFSAFSKSTDSTKAATESELTRINRIFDEVLASGEASEASEKNIRLIQDAAVRANINVSFTDGQSGYDTRTNTVHVSVSEQRAVSEFSRVVGENIAAIRKSRDVNSQHMLYKLKMQTADMIKSGKGYRYEQLGKFSDKQLSAVLDQMKYRYLPQLSAKRQKTYLNLMKEIKTAYEKKTTILELQKALGIEESGKADENTEQLIDIADDGTIQSRTENSSSSENSSVVTRNTEEDLDANLANIDEFAAGNKSFDEVLDNYVVVYSEKVNSNEKWRWDRISGGANLSITQKKLIKQQAIKNGGIVEVPKKQKTQYVDFEKVNLIYQIDGEPVILQLPENYQKVTDKVQFAWLDSQLPNGKRPKGYTWHHSEIDGRMELVPYGIHNVTYHIGGRAPGKWAEGKR